MALGKPRSNKRSSSSSYMPTVTMIVFVAFCILGLWMLTSNSVIPHQTSHATNPFTSSIKPLIVKSIEKKEKDPPAFDDTQGDLPDDAIKGDSEDTKPDETTKENRGDPVAETTIKSGTEIEGSQKQESEEEKSSVVEENAKGVQGKESVEEEEKQKEQGTQVSEESTLTQNQQSQETKTTQGNAETEETQQTQDEEETHHDTDTEEEIRENPHQSQHHMPEEDQQQQEPQEVSNETQQIKLPQPEIREVIRDETQQQEEGSQQSQITTTTTATTDEKSEQSENEKDSSQETQQEKPTESNSGESFPGGIQSGMPKESNESKKAWSTQADQSENQKERRKEGSDEKKSIYGYTWELCNVTVGPDYIPCLDNEKALKQLHSTRHFEHRERHCPEEGPTCLVPLPEGYKPSIGWPRSRDKIWYHNVPHTKLAEVKGHQNWVKVTGEFLTFPGGGTQFIHGALHYIDFIQQSVPNIAWGKRTRVVLDVGCGVASFGGYLFERDVLTMSFAPKDEHEAQVQFALERGIPAISAVMGSHRLPYPGRVFDLVHCARCRVPWHAEGGALLLELNRVLRPGGYFVWSATPVYQKLEEDLEIWKAMSALTISMCWDLFTIKKDKLNSIGAAIYRKPTSNDCYDQRKHNSPPMCKDDDDPNAAWYVPLQACMHRVPVDGAERGSQWPEDWPRRVQKPPYWLNSSQMGIYGKPAPDDFDRDYEHWKRVVNKSYLNGLGISWSNVRNVMDMRAVYGGFAAALKDLNVWVMNVVNINSPDTLPIIYERGLFGIYHDWCESFSTYPRTYDLLHADHLFSRLKTRCKLVTVLAEVDRIVRPGGKLIVRDESSAVGEVENMLKSLHWEVHLTFSKDQEGILSAQKSEWRPDSYAAASASS